MSTFEGRFINESVIDTWLFGVSRIDILGNEASMGFQLSGMSALRPTPYALPPSCHLQPPAQSHVWPYCLLMKGIRVLFISPLRASA